MLNPRRRLIYPINWPASKLMITDGASPFSSLVPDCNPPKAVTLVLADGTLVPMLPLCQASVRDNLKGHYRNSHNYSPPWRKFLPTETKLWLLFLWNPVGLNVLLKCILVTEK